MPNKLKILDEVDELLIHSAIVQKRLRRALRHED